MTSARAKTHDCEPSQSASQADASGRTYPNNLASRTRRLINDALDWLDRHWDDPELRSGFWNSGW